MINHNFRLINSDTDSILVNKFDGSQFTETEQQELLQELNSIFPEHINWDPDGYFHTVIVVKAKNYILLEHGEEKIKLKGSSIKDQKKEPALREMMNRMIHAMVHDQQEQIAHIYHEYIREALNVKDIHRWAQKKTATAPVLDCKGWQEKTIEILQEPVVSFSPETGLTTTFQPKPKFKTTYSNNKGEHRMNEIAPWEAIKLEEIIQQGDKFYVYPAILSTTSTTKIKKNGQPGKTTINKITGLKITKNFTNDYDCDKLLQRVYDTVSIFETVLDMNQFVNYSLVSNRAKAEDV